MSVGFVVGACAWAAAVTMTASGLVHTLSRPALASELAAQGLWDETARRLVSRLLGPLELLAGSTALVGAATVVAGGGHVLATAALAVCAAAYAAFGAFASVLLRARPGAPCACTGLHAQVTWLVPARAALLTAAAVVASVQASALEAPATTTTAAALAGLSFGVLLWILPDALAIPQTTPMEGGAT